MSSKIISETGDNMADTNKKMVNGEIIKAMEKKLETALAQKRLNAKDRLQYEILQLIVMYIAEDHPKTKEMYSTYKPMQAAFLIVAGAMLGAFATGRLLIQFVK